MKSGVVSIEPNPMAPLFQEIKTTQNFLDKKELIVEEKKECDRLQSLIFAEFQAKLVSHSESKNLESEVRQILKNQIALQTQGWEEDTIVKSFDMRK